METDMSDQGKSKRGFASMDEGKQRDIARKGGESVPDEKRSFAQDPQLAAEAGREGGQSSSGQQGDDRGQGGGGQGGGRGQQQAESDNRDGDSGNFSDDRERASEAGRKGGKS
jgi:general stress protein YciG